MKENLKISKVTIGRGTEGIIYATSDREIVYKSYFVEKENEDIEKLEYFTGLKEENFTFPLELDYSKKGKVQGYYKKYAAGYKLYSDQVTLIDFTEAYSNFKKSVDILSEEGIVLRDVTPENFILSGNKLVNIDVDRFTILGINAKLYNEMEYENFLLDYIFLRIHKIPKCNEIVKRFRNIDLDAKETLLETKKILEEIQEKKIYTLNQYIRTINKCAINLQR